MESKKIKEQTSGNNNKTFMKSDKHKSISSVNKNGIHNNNANHPSNTTSSNDIGNCNSSNTSIGSNKVHNYNVKNKEKKPTEQQLKEWNVDLNRISEYGLPAGILPPPKDRLVRIYCDGIWDLFHFGHARALEQAKKIFPNVHLIVGVCNDEITHQKKGKTVMTDKERYQSVYHCKWVDEVVENAPWVIDQAFLDSHQIDYVAHDDIPYKSEDCDDVYAFVKTQGRFLPTKRTDGISTTDLITRIVRDYDKYLRRNLERGISPKDLNISLFKATEIQVRQNVAKITKKISKKVQESEQSIRQNWIDTKNDMPEYVRNNIEYWEETSHVWIKGFTSLFGRDGMPRLLFGKKRPNEETESPSPENSPTQDQKKRRLSLFPLLLPRSFSSPSSPTTNTFPQSEDEEKDSEENV